MLRLSPLLLLIGTALLAVHFDLLRLLTFQSLAEHRRLLLDWIAARPLLSAACYLLLYIALVALSLPGGLVMTIGGGFLFGAWLGGALAVTGATLGATVIFLVARSSLGVLLQERAGPAVERMRRGFAGNAFHYLLVLRLVPLFPFVLVNLVPAFLGVPLRTYFWATLIGITPATFIFATAGSGLGAVFDRGGSFSPASVLTPQMIAALCGLAVLALLPVAYRRWRVQ
ncbi:MAG: TVP38/TMEM64 family protein [Zetaproteobacteria bacterium]|nr:MAG: TVP38/TMEM64 family protein [Zetaproteobacteria bacterium]